MISLRSGSVYNLDPRRRPHIRARPAAWRGFSRIRQLTQPVAQAQHVGATRGEELQPRRRSSRVRRTRSVMNASQVTRSQRRTRSPAPPGPRRRSVVCAGQGARARWSTPSASGPHAPPRPARAAGVCLLRGRGAGRAGPGPARGRDSRSSTADSATATAPLANASRRAGPSSRNAGSLGEAAEVVLARYRSEVIPRPPCPCESRIVTASHRGCAQRCARLASVATPTERKR